MSDWFLLTYHPDTGHKTECKLDEFGNLRVRETIPADDIIELNKARQRAAGEFSEKRTNGLGRPVASIPIPLYNDFLTRCGKDSTGQYDKKMYRKLLNDSDYRHLRVDDPGKKL